MRNWNVLFQPANEITVDTMRVIDAWWSNGDKISATAMMVARMPEYRKKFGEGRVMLVSTKRTLWKAV